jgi:hypothetical protein
VVVKRSVSWTSRTMYTYHGAFDPLFDVRLHLDVSGRMDTGVSKLQARYCGSVSVVSCDDRNLGCPVS